MQYSPHLPVVHIDLQRISRNFDFVKKIAGNQPDSLPTARLPRPGGGEDVLFKWPTQLAVTKADSYGHGHIQVSNELLTHGATLFASGSVQESIMLRKGLSVQGPEAPPIIALLGLVTREDVFLCAAHGIIPMLHSFEQLDMLAGTETDLAVAVKCNTGMGRLGFNEEEIPLVRERLKNRFPRIRPVLAISHMHSADSEQGRDIVATQGAIFARILASLREDWPSLAASLGNSAGTLLADDIFKMIGPHVCRPGVALYGTNPFNGTSLAPLGAGLQSAMAVKTPVLAVRTLKKGEGIGYGHTYVAQKDTQVGIIAAGYADCYARSLSNKGEVCVDGVRAPIIGRVSMQMTAVDLSAVYENRANVRPEFAWLLGGPHADSVSVEELARVWGTITYEVMCLLGYNERRFGPYPEY